MPLPSSTLDCKRALEALRSGVPNRDAVKALGADQPNAEKHFREHMRNAATSGQSGGFLMAGGFGTGKSHLLEYFEHVALSENFVVSRVVISKETPLHDPSKVYRAAIESAIVPGRRGQVIQEIAHTLRHQSTQYAKFYQWANSEDSGLAQIFPATLFLHERLNNDPELVEEVTNFWSGEKLAIGRVRQGLKLLNSTGLFAIEAVPMKILGLQRFPFASRLIRAAGYKGWILLIDEVELIGRYTPLQRGRSYAEVARWVNGGGELSLGPIAAVLAITDDFSLAVIEQNDDRNRIPPKIRLKYSTALAESAAEGIKIIDKGAIPLVAPKEELLAKTYSDLRKIHAAGYAWDPPHLDQVVRTVQRPMRSYVRRWINEWDLRRLNPSADIQIEETSVTTNYSEDPDLEVDSIES